MDYLQINGIRISGTDSSQKAIDFLPSNNAKDARVDNCFIHGTFKYGVYIGQSSSGTTSVNYLTNNIIVIDGTASTTPVGLYLYGADGSSGTTNIYIYNNTIYVANQTTLNNYGIRFANTASSTLNLTCENNAIIGAITSSGASITYCYNQVSFNAGTKTFNNNISSDATADDFSGANHQLNEKAENIWSDAANNDFSLTKSSVALDKGKTIVGLTTDILGRARPQPEGGSYDIGALERKVKIGIVYGVPKDFDDSGSVNIFDGLISVHEHVVNSLIDGPLAQTCQLIYPITKNSVCPNCIFSPRQKRSSNIYKSGGPVPFEIHTTCPWCGGEGRSSRGVKENIKLRVYWTQKDWIISGPVENPDSVVMIIGYMTDLPKIEKADRILLNKDVSAYRKWMCERQGEAIPWGFSQDRYFSQMLRRVSGG